MLSISGTKKPIHDSMMKTNSFNAASKSTTSLKGNNMAMTMKPISQKNKLSSSNDDSNNSTMIG